jgi:hypothetical protein
VKLNKSRLLRYISQLDGSFLKCIAVHRMIIIITNKKEDKMKKEFNKCCGCYIKKINLWVKEKAIKTPKRIHNYQTAAEIQSGKNPDQYIGF